MNITCVPSKQLYYNRVENYRIIACTPVSKDSQVELSKYNNFSIAGNNLDGLTIGKVARIVIEPTEESEYEATYRLVGYQGVALSGKEVIVDRKFAPEILGRIIGEKQKEYVLRAYPDFIELALNGRENEIDCNIIHNVGKKRLAQYVNKVQRNVGSILFYPICNDYGIHDSNDIVKIRTRYKTPSCFQEAIIGNPYEVYCDVLQHPFRKADYSILSQNPYFRRSLVRCQYCCTSLLKSNELSGSTKMKASDLERTAKKFIPEAIEHINTVLSACQLIHYDSESGYVSLTETFQAEQLIAAHIKYRMENPKVTPMNWEKFSKIGDMDLTDEQVKVLQEIQNNSFVFLTGGAGNGKSAAMIAVTRMLEDNGYDYTMLAPTGTAAKVLSSLTGREAHTIHMFLSSLMKCGEFLICEESSMISVKLFANLLESIPRDTKILCVCDPAQLPSIDAGNLVSDIISANIVPNVQLTKVFRYNTSGLITIATDSRNGTGENITKKYDDYMFIGEFENPVDEAVTQYQSMLDSGYSQGDILMLSPFNKGNEGTCIINQIIQERFNKNEFLPIESRINDVTIKFKLGDRVINKKNNYSATLVGSQSQTFIANGSIGIVRRFYENDDGRDCLAVDFDGELVEFAGREIKNLSLGYCITIHAAQGNQNKAVIVLMDDCHKRLLSRNLIYTAFTRAEEKMVVVGSVDAIREGLSREETKLRETNLRELLTSYK